MSKRQKVEMPPKFEDTVSPEFRYIYATGVFGGIAPDDARIIFYLDRLVPETTSREVPGSMELKKVNRELQIEVHCSPFQFKAIAAWMNRNLEQFEKQFGPIRMGPPIPEEEKTASSSMIR